MLICEAESFIYIYELTLEADQPIRQIACLPYPQPNNEASEVREHIAAIWAPDGSAVLLHTSFHAEPYDASPAMEEYIECEVRGTPVCITMQECPTLRTPSLGAFKALLSSKLRKVDS